MGYEARRARGHQATNKTVVPHRKYNIGNRAQSCSLRSHYVRHRRSRYFTRRVKQNHRNLWPTHDWFHQSRRRRKFYRPKRR